MDHIPDENGTRMVLKVPYYSNGFTYDGQEWATFPERAGYPWLAENITVQQLNEHYRTCSIRGLQALAQSWMFFAPLQVFLGSGYKETDFVTQDQETGSWRISTLAAAGWVLRDGSNRPSMEWPGRPDITVNAYQFNTFLGKLYAKTVLWDRFAIGKEQSWVDLALSFKILYEMLTSLPKHLARSRGAWNRHLPTQPGPSQDCLRTSLLQSSQAWCPHQVDALCTTLPYTALAYLTGFPRMQRPGINHTECHEHRACVAYNIDLGVKVQTSHSSQCEDPTTCQNVKAPREERVRILQGGGIPVLRCSEDGRQINLSFVSASPDLKYVAVSHLWADGLGNTFENSLPHCQLSALLKAVRAANSSYRSVGDNSATLLWLDIYCVPAQVPRTAEDLKEDSRSSVERDQDIELKGKAIARMDATYAWADFVLALDSELARMVTADRHPGAAIRQKVKGPQPAGAKTIVCMAISAWNMRCWTYQEHAFARETVLQGRQHQSQYDVQRFGNAIEVTIQHEFLRLVGRHCIMGGGVKEDIGAISRMVLPRQKARLKMKPLPVLSRFGSAWNLFYGRSTTQWKDTIVILTNMLDLSAAAVLRLDHERQMKAVLAAQTSLPISLLFVQMDRLGHGFRKGRSSPFEDRWIPSMPQSVMLDSPGAGDLVDVTPTGLLLKQGKLYRGRVLLFRISLVQKALPRRFLDSRKDDDTLYWCSVEEEQLRYCLDRLPSNPSEAILALDFSDELIPLDNTATFRGACLLPTGYQRDGVHSSVFVGPITWGWLRDPEHGRHEWPYAERIHADESVLLCSGEWNLKCEQAVLTYIYTDISSWPKLPPSRARQLRSFKRVKWAIAIASILIAIISGFIKGFGNAHDAYFAPVSTQTGEICSQYRDLFTGYWNCSSGWTIKIKSAGIVLLVASNLFALGFEQVYVVQYAMQLQLMYAVHSEVDTNSIWWQQLQVIFKLLPVSEVRWYNVWQHLKLRLVVMCIASSVYAWQKTGALFSGKREEVKEDIELQVPLVKGASI